MNKTFLIFLMSIFCVVFTTAQILSDKGLNEFLNHPDIAPASVGLQLRKGSTGEILLAKNADKLLLPASIQKLYTTAYAIDKLPNDYRFKTHVYYSGSIDASKNELLGDLFIKTSGDPSLESRYYPQYSFLGEIKRELAELNITSIRGQLVVLPDYDNYQVNSQWLWGDLGNYYGAGFSTHTFMDNYVEVFFKSSSTSGDSTIIEKIHPHLDEFYIDNKVVSGDTKWDLSYAFGAPYQYERFMIGEIPKNKNGYAVKIAMHDPKEFLIKSVLQTVREIGIEFKRDTSISYDPKDSKNKLLIYRSPDIGELVKFTNYKSNNNFAEHLLLKAVNVPIDKGELEKAASLMQEYWQEKINVKNEILFFDGSGLSRKNLTSANAMNQLLMYELNQSDSTDKSQFFTSLPVAGESGTLKYLGAGSEIRGNFTGKSGSMGSVRSYTGYFLKENEYYPFTIIVNNFTVKNSMVRKHVEKLMINIYHQL